MASWLFPVTTLICFCTAAGQNRATLAPTRFEVRLAAGSGPNEGIVELYYEGRKGAICNPYWDMNDATVVCKQLGFPIATVASSGDRFASSTYGTYLESVSCRGSETSLDQCSYGSWSSGTCSDQNTAAVICSSIEEFSVRLMDGPSRFEGRVEVYHVHAETQPMWGTVCNDYWDIYDAQVVCRQLGYGNARVAVDDGDRLYGQGTGPVLLETVTCFGTESTLASCLTPGWHVHNCGHNEDVGAICEFANTSYVWLSPLAITFTIIGSLLGFAVFVSCIWCCVTSLTKKKRDRRRRRSTAADSTPVSYAASNPAATVVDTAGAPTGYTVPVQHFQPPPGYVVTAGSGSGPGAIGITVEPLAPPPAYSEQPPAEKS